MKTKLTSKEIENYLMDCLGYDELMIDELKDAYGEGLKDVLSEKEEVDCLNYYA